MVLWYDDQLFDRYTWYVFNRDPCSGILIPFDSHIICVVVSSLIPRLIEAQHGYAIVWFGQPWLSLAPQEKGKWLWPIFTTSKLRITEKTACSKHARCHRFPSNIHHQKHIQKKQGWWENHSKKTWKIDNNLYIKSAFKGTCSIRT